jgi:hypothetical protein
MKQIHFDTIKTMSKLNTFPPNFLSIDFITNTNIWQEQIIINHYEAKPSQAKPYKEEITTMRSQCLSPSLFPVFVFPNEAETKPGHGGADVVTEVRG